VREPQIIRQVNPGTFGDAGIDLDVFVMIPASGDAIATFGAAGTPDDQTWNHVAEIVSSIVRQSVGLTHTRCREVACAPTAEAIPPALQEGAPR